MSAASLVLVLPPTQQNPRSRRYVVRARAGVFVIEDRHCINASERFFGRYYTEANATIACDRCNHAEDARRLEAKGGA